MDGSGPLNTDIVPERWSVLPSMSDISVPSPGGRDSVALEGSKDMHRDFRDGSGMIPSGQPVSYNRGEHDATQ